jgi:hypothetical protein
VCSIIAAGGNCCHLSVAFQQKLVFLENIKPWSYFNGGLEEFVDIMVGVKSRRALQSCMQFMGLQSANTSVSNFQIFVQQQGFSSII